MTPETFDYSASATVTLKIRFTGKGHWGKGATVEEVMRNGGTETLTAIKNALNHFDLEYEIIGSPEVGAITWQRKKS